MKKFLFTAAALLILSATTGARAQVTIGSTDNPQPFSILELVGNNNRGLRLPQMTTAQRDDMVNSIEFQAEKSGKASGLQIFNITTKCVETWNGTKWIQACPPEGPFIPHYEPTCDDACKALENFTATPLSGYLEFNDINSSDADLIMKPVTGGMFYMGAECSDPAKPNYDASTDNCSYTDDFPDYHTVHKVALNSFYMAETEVTQGLFKAVMEIENVFIHPSINPWVDGDATGRRLGDNYPAYLVSWYDAIAFCNKLSLLTGRTPCYSIPDIQKLNLTNGTTGWEDLEYGEIPAEYYNNNTSDWDIWNDVTCDFTANGFRLPTEAEWEYAARGGQANEYTRTLGASGTQYIYSGSNNPEDVTWTDDVFAMYEVKGKAPNELGIYDMSGNVYEWCWDWISGYDDCCVSNPVPDGPDETYYPIGSVDHSHALRGGTTGYEPGWHVSDRIFLEGYIRSSEICFRIACSAVSQ